MPSGVSSEGRQVLATMPSSATIAYLSVEIPSGSAPVKYRGFFALEVVSPSNSIPYQIVGKPLWFRGLVLILPFSFGLDIDVVGYWRESGVQWDVIF